jgi:hypothetical protein
MMFRNLCGTETYKNVVVLTTFWDRTDVQEGARREEQLKSGAFKDLVDGGSRFMRYDRTVESAGKVLGHILTLMPANIHIQEEIRRDHKRLEDTAPGSVHREEVECIIAKHVKEVDDLRAELVATRTANEAMRRELEADRAQVGAMGEGEIIVAERP